MKRILRFGTCCLALLLLIQSVVPAAHGRTAQSGMLLQNLVDLFILGPEHQPEPPESEEPLPNPALHRIDWRFILYDAPDFRAAQVAVSGPQVVEILRELDNGWAQIRTDNGSAWVFLPADARFINRGFSIYEEPDFHAPRIAMFAPQVVEILREPGNGWAQIATDYGDYWVYLNANMRFIERPTGLYAEQGDALPLTALAPQVVEILAQVGTWLQISTREGPRWIDLDFTPPTQELTALLGRHGNRLSVYFENLETGFVFRHNAERVYVSASVPKAAFSLYIFEKAERGETDLGTQLTFTSADFTRWYSEMSRNYRIGTTFSQLDLLRYNVSWSDNAATDILRRHHGLNGYRQFLEDIGGNRNFVGSRIVNSQLTANEAGLHAREIFRYLESDGRFSETFLEQLLNNQFPFIVSDYPVASKSGWTPPSAWHDMAIVYAPSPYILVILSARSGWTAADYRDFAEISMAFQAFNDMWFVY
ncbi:MAG: serine hydrolase [Oscillospiraceae bacterium]|nr:serine hydrolase [Oscillospiraceae bacterium]